MLVVVPRDEGVVDGDSMKKEEDDGDEIKATRNKAVGGNANSSKGNNVKCKRCDAMGHKRVRCPDQVCSVCGGKGHVTALACVDRTAVMLTVVRKSVVRMRKLSCAMCDVLGYLSGVSSELDEGDYRASLAGGG